MERPRVDFYVLPTADSVARLRYACRLIEKAWLQEHRVDVRCGGSDEAAQLDDLLWTFADRSFVPHERWTGDAAAAPVLIADGDAPEPAAGELLVNLGADVASGWNRYARIAEIVDADGERRRLGRDRFRFYRDQGLEPATHETGGEP